MHAYIFFLGRVQSFCHILKGLSHGLQTLRPHGLEPALSMGVILPPSQEVKNWYRDENLRCYNVCVLPKGHSMYKDTIAYW